jgi:Icc-related predicted phosphoesterase
VAWQAFQAKHSLDCLAAPEERLDAPVAFEKAGFRYVLSGALAQVRRAAPRAGPEIKLGVLSGIKELDAKTKASLDAFLARFKAEGVEGLLVGGDSAEDGSGLDDVFEYLGATDLPVYVVIGNWEPRAPFNRALREVSAKHPNVLNLQLIRRVDAEGFDVLSLGGYHDKQYVRNTGACLYKPEDVEAVGALAKTVDDPALLLMHGPPLQKGKDALDYVPDAGSRGDPAVAAMLADAKIPFGIFGHILEAGLKATDASGKPVAAGKWSSTLWVNPGAANSLPWKLNSGQTSHGSAALLTVKGKQAKVDWLVTPKP